MMMVVVFYFEGMPRSESSKSEGEKQTNPQCRQNHDPGNKKYERNPD